MIETKKVHQRMKEMKDLLLIIEGMIKMMKMEEDREVTLIKIDIDLHLVKINSLLEMELKSFILEIYLQMLQKMI